MNRIVLRHDRTRHRVKDVEAIVANLFRWLGTAFLVVGLIDLALLWIPPGFGTTAWEFATLTQTFDSLPMTTLGLGLIAVGSLQHPRPRPLTVRGLAILFGLIALTLIVLAALEFTVVPEVLRQAPPETIDVLNREVIKNVAEVVIYPLALGALALMLWRAVVRSR